MRHFDPITLTEAIPGIHNLEGTTELPDDNWFFVDSKIPDGKVLSVNDQMQPILIDSKEK
ncbi:hypothetical protein CIG19_07160 [Enterobacterales bacterium CwR94]|nr:hypothetical protein CIG19_07160 [Enterobacterales bacterium CwR94]